jgi:hypothetical protein
MTLDDDEQRRLADIEHHLHESDPQLADTLSRWLPPRPARPKISVDSAVAVGLALGWLAAGLDHALLAIAALITVVAGVWLALRRSDPPDRDE